MSELIEEARGYWEYIPWEPPGNETEAESLVRRLADALESAMAKLAAVEALHPERRFTWTSGQTGEELVNVYCRHCGAWDAPGEWPCATRAALGLLVGGENDGE